MTASSAGESQVNIYAAVFFSSRNSFWKSSDHEDDGLVRVVPQIAVLFHYWKLCKSEIKFKVASRAVTVHPFSKIDFEIRSHLITVFHVSSCIHILDDIYGYNFPPHAHLQVVLRC